MGNPDPEKAARETAKDLERSFAEVDSPAEARDVMDRVEGIAGDRREEDVTPPARSDTAPREPAAALAHAGAKAADESPAGQAAADGMVERLEDGPQRAGTAEGRNLLRRELLRRLQPFEAVDTIFFLGINGLPHPVPVDRFFRGLSWFMKGGHAWILVPLLELPRDRRHATHVLVRVMPAIWLTTALLEYPVKHFFRRRRPFLSIVRSIVVGRKPGSYSFPSGHSAAAFGGAILLARHYPRARGPLLAVAGLVGFSRVYLGAHYPGDVVSGGLLGMATSGIFAGLVRRALGYFRQT